MTSYYIGYQIPYNFSTSTEYILVGTAGDFVYIDNNGALASAGEFLNIRDGYLTIGGALRIVELNEAPDTPIDGYGYLYVDSSGALHFKNDEGLDIALAATGDAITIGNIGAGTLAELNTAISDATLDDAGDPRDPNSHADSHVLDGTDELDGYNLAIDYTPTNYTSPTNGIIGEHIAAIDAALSNPVTDLTIADEEQGSILYFDGSDWVQLAPGDDGYALVTHSTGANPTWSSVQAAAAPVDSVFGRTGAITAASDDYAASEIDNDSSVTGEQVSDALEYLDGYIKDVADDLNVHELDTNNPHSTSIANIGAGTLAELNTAVSDATLDDSGDPRDPNAHADTHIADGDDEIDGYNLAIDYTPTNYTAPTNGIIGEHIAAIDGALGSGSGGSAGGTGTPFTVTTVTVKVPVELAMAVTLPAAPSEGDICAVGFLIEAVIARKNGSIESHAISYWASFTFTYSSGVWTCNGGWEIGMPGDGNSSFYYPNYTQLAVGYSPSLPAARTTAPIAFLTADDTDGLFVIKGTYRQISRIDF